MFSMTSHSYNPGFSDASSIGKYTWHRIHSNNVFIVMYTNIWFGIKFVSFFIKWQYFNFFEALISTILYEYSVPSFISSMACFCIAKYFQNAVNYHNAFLRLQISVDQNFPINFPYISFQLLLLLRKKRGSR